MMPKAPFLLACSVFLVACSSGDSAIDGVREIPNRFGDTVNALDDFNSGSTGDSGNTSGLAANEVRVTMEVPAYYAPEAEQTRRNLRLVVPDQVAVFRTNPGLSDRREVAHSISRDAGGQPVVRFDHGVPIGPDVVIEATYGPVTLLATATDSDRDVKINPFSHYLVTEGLGNYSAAAFNQVMDCVQGSGNELCLNRYVWADLADQVQDFEIDIPDNFDLANATRLLAERRDFAGFVQAMASYAQLSEDASGRITASSEDYNTVLFGLDLGQTFREPSIAGAGQWSVRTAREARLDNSQAFLYPALTLTTFEAFNINVTSLATDIPYQRQASVQSGFNFFFRDFEANRHSTSPGAATLTPPFALDDPATGDTDATRMLAGRAVYQTVTEDNRNRLNGWTRNPYFLDAFAPEPEDERSGPDRVLASYFTAGKAIQLNDDNGQLQRQETLETYYSSMFEISLLRSDAGTTDEPRRPAFSLAAVDGKRYNLVYLATRFADNQPPAFEVGYGDWPLSAAGAQEAGGESHADSFMISRRNGNPANVVSRASADNRALWNLRNRVSRMSNGERYIGRLSLFNQQADTGANPDGPEQPDMGLGASTPDGSLLAFNLAGSYLGNGLMVAAAAPSAPLPEQASYRVQGVIVGLADEENQLDHLSGGTLTIRGSDAQLESDLVEVSHRPATDELGLPARTRPASGTSRAPDLTGHYTLNANPDGRLLLSASGYSLEGFYTGQGDQIFLVLKDGQPANPRTGLIMATRIPDTRG